MNELTVLQVLETGFAGFSFLMVHFGYRLIKTEQTRPDNPRPAIIRIIKVFMIVTLIFGTMLLASTAIQILSPDNGFDARDVEELTRMRTLSRAPSHTVESLRELIANTVDRIHSD